MKQTRLISRIAAICTALITALLCTLSVSADGETVQDVLNRNTEWNSFVIEKMQQDKTPGLVLSAVRGTETGTWHMGGDGEFPITEYSIFGIGSCSKAFTALTIFLLQEDGKLSIEDSVSDYLPWWDVTWQGQPQDTKIWQLLNHCSGLPNSTMMQCPIGDDPALIEQNVRLAEHCRLHYEPGTQFEYCNLGYDVLAYITETVSGMPFAEFITTRLFQPLNMMTTGYSMLTVQGSRRLYGMMLPYTPPDMRASDGCGGIQTSALNMELWMQAQLGIGKIPDDIRAAIAASHERPEAHKVPGTEIDYFNGWMFMPDGTMLHSGTMPDLSAYVILDPASQTGIFCAANAFCNTADYAANSLMMMMNRGTIDREQLNAPDLMRLLDYAGIGVTAVGALLLIAAVIALCTQKKRLEMLNADSGKERRKFAVRLIFLLIGIAAALLIPCLLGFLFGYGFIKYRMLLLWFPYSFTIGFFVIAAALLVMLLGAAVRFARQRRRGDV